MAHKIQKQINTVEKGIGVNLIRLLQTYKKLKMSDREKELKKKTTLRNLVFTQ